MDGGRKNPAVADCGYAIAWTLIIYATVPVAQPVMQFLGRNFGGDPVLGKAMAALVLTVVALTGMRLVRRPLFGVKQAAAGVAVVSGYIYFMCTMKIPAEKIHFLEFGILVVLAFRAFRHAFANRYVYLLILPLCLLVGLVDESIQSIVPKRVGEIEDVFKWDLASIVLALVGLSLAWMPEGLHQPPGKRQVWATFGGWAAALIGTALFMHALSDFGYRINDPNIGCFNSAFVRSELKRIDAAHGAETAPLIDASDDTDYRRFLEIHTSRNDPYVHEARVHVYRRDKYLKKFMTPADAPTDAEKTRMLHVAVMENRILEIYFPELISHSNRHWKEMKSGLERQLRDRGALTPNYESAVGEGMIILFGLQDLWIGTALLIVILFIVAAQISTRLPNS